MSPEYLQAYLLFSEEWVILVQYVSSTLLKTICSRQLGVVRYFGTSLSRRDNQGTRKGQAISLKDVASKRA